MMAFDVFWNFPREPGQQPTPLIRCALAFAIPVFRPILGVNVRGLSPPSLGGLDSRFRRY